MSPTRHRLGLLIALAVILLSFAVLPGPRPRTPPTPCCPRADQ
ncbi:hypothetical protein J2S54_000122 [Streptomyces sp. DSM 42143]|nr:MULTISPECIES: hypothetical protein [unclassified Streptomyces]MDN3247597.1 hypothetical protein [Streptomyces sp. ZSW22]MDN3254073.1 hypothetical protein [Streptomyces sp. MA25(2023)]MDQ0383302.1 hypothetical protein [Streptomyces sp. DSM 42143]